MKVLEMWRKIPEKRKSPRKIEQKKFVSEEHQKQIIYVRNVLSRMRQTKSRQQFVSNLNNSIQNFNLRWKQEKRKNSRGKQFHNPESITFKGVKFQIPKELQ